MKNKILGYGQIGSALVISLIMLAVGSLVTVASINTGSMQERMTSNQDNYARAFMAAEAGGAALFDWLQDPASDLSISPSTLPTPVIGDPNDDTLMRYFLMISQDWGDNWPNGQLPVTIIGEALAADGTTVLARSELRILLTREITPAPDDDISPIDVPATISCFGAPCRLCAGAGRGADEGFGTISGFDHPIPPLSCNGAGCRMQPQGSNRNLPNVPSVFLTNTVGSTVGVTGGSGGCSGNFNAYHGLNQSGDSLIAGNGIGVAKAPSDYPLDSEGQSTSPTLESVFGDKFNSLETKLESGLNVSQIGGSDFEVGTLVVSDNNLTMSGGPLFVGLVVIKNCRTLTMSGNPNIYGAVIVDAVQRDADGNETGPCPAGYDPFGGNGTPAIRYSTEALLRAAVLLGGESGGGGGGGGGGGTVSIKASGWTVN